MDEQALLGLNPNADLDFRQRVSECTSSSGVFCDLMGTKLTLPLEQSRISSQDFDG